MTGQFRAVAEGDEAPRSLNSQGSHLLRCQNLDAKASRLRHRPSCQIGAAETGREAEVVLDPRAHPGLTAWRLPFDEDGVQTLRGAVDGRGQPSRTAADDYQIVEGAGRLGLQPNLVGDLPDRWRFQTRAVAEYQQRQMGAFRS